MEYFHLILSQKKFLATLTKELTDESNGENVRQMAAVLIKNFIVNRGGVSFKSIENL